MEALAIPASAGYLPMMVRMERVPSDFSNLVKMSCSWSTFGRMARLALSAR
jgi:hypothetical protein